MKYATLYQLRQYLGLAASETTDDALLGEILDWVSGMIDDVRRCDARKETRLFDYPLKRSSSFGIFSVDEWVAQMNAAGDISKGVLRMDDDLLEVTTITNGDATTVASNEYVLQPANKYPKARIKLLGSSGVAWQPSDDGDREQCISVAGLWGWHPDYDSRAWEDSGDTVQDNPLSNSATTLTVTDVDGSTIYGGAMRFQAGQVLKIESEQVLVISTNTTANTMVIRRAYNGTTAASHVKTTTVYIYRPYEKIKTCALRMATWRYRQKDLFGNSFDQVTILGTGVAITPVALPPDVRELLPPARVMDLADLEAL